MLRAFCILLLCSSYPLQLLAQGNHTLVKPLECFLAESDSKNLATATAFSTTMYAVGYRTLNVLSVLFRVLLTPPKGQEGSRFKRGLLAGLEVASKPPEGLITAVQALSIVSFLVPPYWVWKSYHSQAECDHAISLQNKPNHTDPKECYKADADDSIFSVNLAYSAGLYVGVYIFLPIVATMIKAWTTDPDPETQSQDTSPNAPETGKISKISFALDLPSDAGCCTKTRAAFGAALKLAMIQAGPYALISAEQVTAIINFLIPLYGWHQKYESRARCDHAKAMQTINQT